MFEWTAISKPPYYTALALWAHLNHTGAWGGFFLDNNIIYFQGDSKTPSKGRLPKSFRVITFSHEEDNKIWRKKVLLNGWQIEKERVWEYPPGRLAQPEVRRKESKAGRYSIILEIGFHSQRYLLEDRHNRVKLDFADATWMDWDQQGRLVFTIEGQLFVSPPDELKPRVIGDFNSDEPREVIAPDWARTW